MRIAFDLDDTLIPGACEFPVEPLPVNPLRRWFCAEPVRLGTGGLFRELTSAGHDVWIYTTSFRSPASVKLLFWGYGAPVRRVINQSVHARCVEALGCAYRTCTKYPPAFGIDLLVDECLGVAEESRRYNFSALRISPDDADWTATVLAALR
jgi:hypothetical protein